MTKKKDYLKRLIKQHFEDIVDKDQINIDNALLEKLIVDIQISKGIEMLQKKINILSEDILPTLSLKYKLPNISVGKEKNLIIEYIDIPTEQLDNYQVTEIIGLNGIGGISWDIETQSFEGIAENAGSFQLEIKGIYSVSEGVRQKTLGTCTLTVIPDPKSLWKILEPDEAIPYAKAHEDSLSMTSKDGGRLLYVSKRGRSHAHAGTYRDDDGKLLISNAGWSLVAVADGGGSYSLSRRGSMLAVDASITALEKVLSGRMGNELEEAFFKNAELNSQESKEILNTKLRETILSAAFTGLHAIKAEAEETKNDIKDYSTTLLIAAHKNTPNGHLIVTFWVGDGVIALYTKEKDILLLGEPDSGEFAGQTRFLDDSFFHDTSRVRIKLVKDFTALILATDGVSDPFFETDESLDDIKKWDNFWEKIGSFATNKNIKVAETELLKWLDFWSPGNHDDRSMALLLPGMEDEIKDDENNENQNNVPDLSSTDDEPMSNLDKEDIQTQSNDIDVDKNIEEKEKDESFNLEAQTSSELLIVKNKKSVSATDSESIELIQNKNPKDDEDG